MLKQLTCSEIVSFKPYVSWVNMHISSSHKIQFSQTLAGVTEITAVKVSVVWTDVAQLHRINQASSYNANKHTF